MRKKCCSITAFPLQICRALTIHKSQGITIGEGEQFKRVAVHLPDNVHCPGLPLVNDEVKLLLLSNIITIVDHAWAILSSQTFQHQPGSGSDHHTRKACWQFSDSFFGVSHHGSNGLSLVKLISVIPLWIHNVHLILCAAGHAWAIAQ
jgi:hypothetical protein